MSSTVIGYVDDLISVGVLVAHEPPDSIVYLENMNSLTLKPKHRSSEKAPGMNNLGKKANWRVFFLVSPVTLMSRAITNMEKFAL